MAVHCRAGSGPAFFSGTQFASLADQFKFIVVYPFATRSGSCFDVSSPGALTHNGTQPPIGACRVTYTINAWNTGLTASVTIANTGTTAINGWSLVFTLPSGQTITSGWNATYTPASGQITARNMSYNAALAPGASTNIGFRASHNGNTGRPTSFTLNGSACGIA